MNESSKVILGLVSVSMGVGMMVFLISLSQPTPRLLPTEEVATTKEAQVVTVGPLMSAPIKETKRIKRVLLVSNNPTTIGSELFGESSKRAIEYDPFSGHSVRGSSDSNVNTSEVFSGSSGNVLEYDTCVGTACVDRDG